MDAENRSEEERMHESEQHPFPLQPEPAPEPEPEPVPPPEPVPEPAPVPPTPAPMPSAPGAHLKGVQGEMARYGVRQEDLLAKLRAHPGLSGQEGPLQELLSREQESVDSEGWFNVVPAVSQEWRAEHPDEPIPAPEPAMMGVLQTLQDHRLGEWRHAGDPPVVQARLFTPAFMGVATRP